MSPIPVVPFFLLAGEPKYSLVSLSVFLEELQSQQGGYSKDFEIDYQWFSFVTADFDARLDQILEHTNNGTITAGGFYDPAVYSTIPCIIVSGEKAAASAKSIITGKAASKQRPLVLTVSDQAYTTGSRPAAHFWCGNSTDISQSATCQDLYKKFHEAFPALNRIGILWKSPEKNGIRNQLVDGLGLTVEDRGLAAYSTGDLEAALKDLEGKIDRLMVIGDSFMMANQRKIIDYAMNTDARRTPWPTLFTAKQYVLAQGLMAYGPDFLDMYRGAARIAAKFIAKPTQAASDLPVFRLAVPFANGNRPNNLWQADARWYFNRRTEAKLKAAGITVDAAFAATLSQMTLLWA
jgi:hypothetical protein